MTTARRIGGPATLALAMALAGCTGQAAETRRSPALVEPPPVPVELLARMDATLTLAIEQGQLAERGASNVALRAFAVQQAGLYEELRTEMRRLAAGLGEAPAARPAPVVVDERLGALRVARGAQFDHAYVRQALTVHQELLGDLDAALRLVEDAETRRTLEELRGGVDGTGPPRAAGR